MNKDNKKLRTKFRQDPHSVLNYISKDIDIVVKTNTKDTIYMVISKENKDIVLNNLSAGGSIHLETLGSAGSVSTIGSGAFTTLSSAGTASTIATGIGISNVEPIK